MNRTCDEKGMNMKTRMIWSLVLLIPFAVQASLPTIPFSGSSGATAGAGSLVGWERNGLGVNPAVSDSHSASVSLAGYSPFGIGEVHVLEGTASWDGGWFGTSLAYRGLVASDDVSASVWQIQEAVRLGWGFATGLSGQFQNDEDEQGFGGSAGILWNKFSFLSLGGSVETSPLLQGREITGDIGADIGTNFFGAYAWRFSVEEFYSTYRDVEYRFGAILRLHSLLSIHGGWSPQTETVALGIRFGMGNWEGFSALRRHSALGTTSIQGLHWRKNLGP